MFCLNELECSVSKTVIFFIMCIVTVGGNPPAKLRLSQSSGLNLSQQFILPGSSKRDSSHPMRGD